MTYPIIRYTNPHAAIEIRVAILFDGETVKVWLREGANDIYPILVSPGTGIEIVGALTEINRIKKVTVPHSSRR